MSRTEISVSSALSPTSSGNLTIRACGRSPATFSAPTSPARSRSKHTYTVGISRNGRPMENGYMESFNGRFRDECLNENWFSDLGDAREKIAHWKQDYNERRPHSSLQYRTPVEFAAQSAVSPRSTGPQDPQNPIQDGTSILPWTTPPVSARSRFRDQRVENFPLGIEQV